MFLYNDCNLYMLEKNIIINKIRLKLTSLYSYSLQTRTCMYTPAAGVGQAWGLQSSRSLRVPEQSLPPLAGRGSVQVRARDLFPPPQETEQVPQAPHWLQVPSTTYSKAWNYNGLRWIPIDFVINTLYSVCMHDLLWNIDDINWFKHIY